MTLYFAYGSNLSQQKMQRFAPKAEVVAITALQDHLFALVHRWFDGSAKASVLAEKGARVWGVLYDVSAEELAALDTMERVGREYSRCEMTVYDKDDRPYQAWIYIGLSHHSDLVATEVYCRRILDGACEHNLPAHYQGFLSMVCKESLSS